MYRHYPDPRPAAAPRLRGQAEINFSLAVAEVGGAAIINAGTYRKITLLFNQIEEHERFLGNIIDCIGAQLLVFDRQLRVVVAEPGVSHGPWSHGVRGAGHDLRPALPGEGRGKMLSGGRCAVFRAAGPSGAGAAGGRTAALVRTDRDAALSNAAGEVEYVIEIIHDITAERRLKSAEAERVKLAGVIELAGTVAHEINSPLFVALGTAQLLQEDAQSEEDEGVGCDDRPQPEGHRRTDGEDDQDDRLSQPRLRRGNPDHRPGVSEYGRRQTRENRQLQGFRLIARKRTRQRKEGQI